MRSRRCPRSPKSLWHCSRKVLGQIQAVISGGKSSLRFRIVLIQKPASVVLVKDAGEAPWMVLEWLHVLDLHKENVSWLGCLDLEGAREIVDLRQVDILDVVGVVRVLDLAACPVQAFNLDSLAFLDGPAEGYSKQGLARASGRVRVDVPSGCHLFCILVSHCQSSLTVPLLTCRHGWSFAGMSRSTFKAVLIAPGMVARKGSCLVVTGTD